MLSVSETCLTFRTEHLGRLSSSRPSGHNDARSRLELRPTPQERFLKVLVVGRKGLGKTTWISNMQAVYGSSEELAAANYQPDDAEAHAANEDAEMRNFKKDPCHMLTEMTLRDDRSLVTHHICIQDTPGYSKEVPVKHVTSYVRQQNKHFFDMEQSARRRVPVSALPDTRVDVCIFFLPAGPLRSHDMAALSAIGSLVPIVPVIAKADVLDPDELRRVRKRIAAALDMMRVNDGLNCRHSFPADDITAAGAPSSQIFTIIGGNVLEQHDGRRWPARKYTWGKCETLLPENSDVLALSRLLFELSITDLKDKTELRYLELRRRCLLVKSKRKEAEVASKLQQMEANQQENVERMAAKLQGMQELPCLADVHLPFVK
ncbi:hypothetical protein WJX73_007838 [Symbiochloris irregularis]|uniref:Septin-type G domain-containing protein n=1 Tax=Symbiochloris irregularis TaxID=706552 RepID=A0AAW1NVH1_9CHLO